LDFDLGFDLAFESAFDPNSHVALPIVRGGKWIRSEACLSAASLLHFPFYDLHNWVSRRDSDFCVAFFGIPFLAKQKRYVVAGLPPASNRTTTTEVNQAPCQCAYPMRICGQMPPASAWNMRTGLACFSNLD
jgi:hypothetical protein